MKLFLLVFLTLTVIALDCCAQQVNDKYIAEIFTIFQEGDSKKIGDMLSDSAQFRDLTFGVLVKSKNGIVDYFKKVRKQSLPAFTVQNVFIIGTRVASVNGKMETNIGDKIFSSNFSTVIVFDAKLRIIKWTDHYDPDMFSK